MRNRFDEWLELLNAELIRMGSLCEDVTQGASKALMGRSALAEQVYAIEHEIDQRERDIENLCLKLLSKQQPMAKDLRLVSAAFKMILDMGRIGDQVSDIAEIVAYLKDSEVESKVHINDMTEATMKTMTASIDSFMKKNLEIAREVIKNDGVVDDLFDKVGEELIELIGKNRVNGGFCTDLLMIAKYFERIGDHATNTAEWVEYSITGTHITIQGE